MSKRRLPFKKNKKTKKIRKKRGPYKKKEEPSMLRFSKIVSYGNKNVFTTRRNPRYIGKFRNLNVTIPKLPKLPRGRPRKSSPAI